MIRRRTTREVTHSMQRALRSAVAAALFLVAPVLSAQSREPYPGLDAYVNAAIATWKVPGLGLAIVRNDSVIYATGYGVRELGKSATVDEKTIFAIGSSSKAFTSASIAMLVDQGKVDLDGKVTAYLPGFQLFDPYATRELTLRDILAHRSGLARGELAWYGSASDRDEIVRRVRFLEPSWSFRLQFGYQNIMYITAGQVVAKVGGVSWDDYLRDHILLPLGMTSTSTTTKGLETQADLSSPHADVDGVVKAIARRNIDNAGPAGSLNSNVLDMAQWVRLHLNEGTVDSKVLVSRKLMQDMHTPHTLIRVDSASRRLNPDTHFSSYGLGWFLEDYRGREVWHHGGNIDGYSALVAMLPEEKLGLVILTNMNGTGLPQALMHKIFDLQTKAPARDWSADMWKRTQEAMARAKTARQRADSQRVKDTKPSLALAEYVGTYSDSLHGDVVIRLETGALQLVFGPTWKGTLTHWNFDTFRVKFDTPVLPAINVQFQLSPAGKVTEAVLDMAGVPTTFKRRADARGTRAGKPVDYSAPPGAPYLAVNVEVPTPMGHVLSGTLTLPVGASREHPVPAIMTITGSGPTLRDEDLPGTLEGYRAFRQIADSLGRRGIAVLRMDDRGTGLSKGNFATATSADFAEDIRAGLAWLRTRPEIDGKRLGLVGHSEGGLIAPLVALKEPELRGIVLLAGPGKGGREILQFQLTNLAKKDTTLTGVKRDSAVARIPARMDSLAAANPWMKYFLSYDPLATARQVKVPVLILNGATDQQVTPDQVPVLVNAFKKAGNKDVTSKVFPEMNHLFVHDPVGFPGNYGKLENPRVEPEVVGMVADWLVKRMK